MNAARDPRKAFDYSEKVDALLDGRLSGVGSFDDTDFLVLMQAAADQAGLSLATQKAILAVISAALSGGGR